MTLHAGCTTRQIIVNGKAFVRALSVDSNSVPTFFEDLGGEAPVQVYPTENYLHTADVTLELHVKTSEEGGTVIKDNLGNQYLQINGVS